MQLSYFGVEFEILLMNSFEMVPVRSADNMDYMYSKISIDCQGVLNPATMSYSLVGPDLVPGAGNLPTTTVAAIRHLLLQNRGPLSITDVDDQTLLQSPDPGLPCDVKGGPFPKSCTITEFQGSQTFFIRFQVETYILECPDGYDFDPPILSNRWQGSSTVDGTSHLTTIQYMGRVVFHRGLLELAGDQVDSVIVRNLVLPPCPPDFQRTGIHIIRNSDGNEIGWRVTDEGRMFDLGNTDAGLGGSGIVSISGSHGIRSISADGGVATGTTLFTLNLRADGNAVSDQWRMTQRLIVILTTLVDVSNALFLIRSAEINQGIDQDAKWVDLSIAIQLPQLDRPGVIGNLRVDTLRVDEWKLFTDLLPAEPGGAIGNPAIPNAGFGTTLVSLVVQALSGSESGPCAGVPDFPEAPSISPGDDTPVEGPTYDLRVDTFDYLPEYNPRYGPQPTSTSFYTEYKCSMRFELDAGTIQCPISGVPQSPGSSGSGGGGGGSSSYNGPSSLIFQVAMPMAELVCEGTAECAGSPPLMPSINPTDINLVLKKPIIVCQAPIMANDAVTPVYRVSFSYRYYFLNAFDTSNPTLAMGALPWVALNFTDNFLTPDMFSSGIFSDPSGGPVAATPNQ